MAMAIISSWQMAYVSYDDSNYWVASLFISILFNWLIFDVMICLLVKMLGFTNKSGLWKVMRLNGFAK
jgi:hypothetical protein